MNLIPSIIILRIFTNKTIFIKIHTNNYYNIRDFTNHVYNNVVKITMYRLYRERTNV